MSISLGGDFGDAFGEAEYVSLFEGSDMVVLLPVVLWGGEVVGY